MDILNSLLVHKHLVILYLSDIFILVFCLVLCCIHLFYLLDNTSCSEGDMIMQDEMHLTSEILSLGQRQNEIEICSPILNSYK